MIFEDFKNKPLPDHTKIDYYECLAKIVLEEIFSKEFERLEIIDKPDLQNNEKDTGIEVTIARNGKQLENEKLFCKILYNMIQDKESAIKK